MASEQMKRIADRMRTHRDDPSDSARADYASGNYEGRRAAMDDHAPPPLPDAAVEPIDADGVYAEWVRMPKSDPGRRLLYLHGGAYLTGSPVYRRRLASDIAAAGRCSVLLPKYRLAPEHTFPAALEDAMTAFRWMRGHGPDGPAAASSTFVAGDSAGGGLTLSVLLSLRDAGESQANGGIALSAWTDLAVTAKSLETRGALDPTNVGRGPVVQMANDYLGGADPKDPHASPLYGDYEGLAPLLLQVGDHEVLLDDTTRVAERAEAAGVEVTLEVEPEAFHCFQSLAANVPEAQEAVNRIGAFIERHAGS